MVSSHGSSSPGIGQLDVGLLERHEEPAWESFVQSRSEATFYHSLCWRDVTVDGLGHKPLYLRARDEKGDIQGVLPLFLVTGLFGRRLVSVPMRDRGGLLIRDLEVGRALLSEADRLARDLMCTYLELKSLNPLPFVLKQEFGFVEDRSWINSRLGLAPGEQEIWRSLDRNAARYPVRKARREGVVVKFDTSRNAADLFHELFVRTRTSMGIPPYSRKFIRSLWKHGIESGMGHIVFAYLDGEPINAMINLHKSETVIAAYAAPQNEYRDYNPSDVIFWETIAWACQHGYRFVDFGADSEEQGGLLWFKRKWGCSQEPVTYSYLLYDRDEPPNLDSSAARYRTARKVWRVLPRTVASYVGGLVCEQLS